MIPEMCNVIPFFEAFLIMDMIITVGGGACPKVQMAIPTENMMLSTFH